ncbi:hypothetical protein MGG_15378 [Pyricularia oryzae 70-15]|uniref:Uncharacterized protein n=3 Tax=Pyricularia oryzae TaxID=318829 RepID=G4NFS1_PYRO7|nr:uncharacterized protein MGG_15378 [Pyricularia oryzae 70-15]EHA46878.1 hypothetical protein MGG_15378 [Pyricularia oryzae 70-15]ELQ32669.1 hypothetical protein OOU_Y34scaffold01075g25 [Pyricularia oryzae Y34]
MSVRVLPRYLGVLVSQLLVSFGCITAGCVSIFGIIINAGWRWSSRVVIQLLMLVPQQPPVEIFASGHATEKGRARPAVKKPMQKKQLTHKLGPVDQHLLPASQVV